MDGIILCERQEGNPPCTYRQESRCIHAPANFKEYCNYELKFINERFQDLKILYEKFRKFYHKKHGITRFRINYTILWEICFIYANDLKPVRQFHDIQGGCDRCRRAAFLSRLISKHHPIQIHEFSLPDVPESQKDELLKVNEHLAFHCLNHFLDLPPELFSQREDTEVGKEMKKLSKELIFIFGHRDPQTESLVCIARLLSRTAAQFKALGAAAVRETELKDKIKDLKAKSAAALKAVVEAEKLRAKKP